MFFFFHIRYRIDKDVTKNSLERFTDKKKMKILKDFKLDLTLQYRNYSEDRIF